MRTEEVESYSRLGYLTLGSAYCRSNHKNGGVAVFIKPNLNYVVIDVNDFCDEMNIELASIELVDSSLIVMAAYRPPSGSLDIFFNLLDDCLSYLGNKGKTIMIGGDFNINLAVNSDVSNMFSCVLKSHGLFIANHAPTRGGNCLDTVATTLNSWEYEVTVDRQVIADHYPINIDVIIDPVSGNTFPWQAKYRRTTRIINDDGLRSFKLQLSMVDWSTIISSLHAEEAFNSFFYCFKHNFDLVFPEKLLSNARPSVNKPKSHRNTWYSSELANIKKFVVAVNDRYKQAQGAEKDRFYQAYLNAKRIYQRRVNLAKKHANMQRIEAAPNKCKAAWDLVRETNKPVAMIKCSASPDVFNGHLLDEVNRVICSIPAENIDPEDPSTRVNINQEVAEFSFWDPVSPEQVLKMIMDFKNSHSQDIYGMSTIVLKHVGDVIAAPLAAVINTCLHHGVFPDVLKVSRTVPIFKKGDPELVLNYRPISLIPVLAKVFETVLKSQLIKYFENNEYFSQSQHGFRGGKSTFTAASQLVSNILEAFERRDSVALVLADLSKAFDCVSHEILLRKLCRYGVSNSSLQMLRSYLLNRQQMVSIRGALSSPLPVRHGVPQGSVMGPILFLIAINDISLLGDILLFADDTTIYSFGKTPHEAIANADVIFSRVKDWFRVNKLSLNRDKTQEMVCSLANTDMIVENNETVKLLGYLLDPKLSWKQHIDNVCSKLARVTFLLRRLKLQLTEEHLLHIYHGLFSCHLSYGLLLWGHSPSCKAVLKLQKRALRVITSAGWRDHCKPIFRKCKILTVYSLYILLSLVHVKANEASLLTRAQSHNHHLRSGHLIDTPFCRLSKKKDCFPVLAFNMYNRLPVSVRLLKASTFRARVKTWLLEEAFYSLEEFFDSDLNNV